LYQYALGRDYKGKYGQAIEGHLLDSPAFFFAIKECQRTGERKGGGKQ
jgi:hypothetical protein